MKKLILVMSFITGLSFMANAQMMQKSPEQRAKHMTKVLQRTLNLSADQTTQVNAALYTQTTRMDSLKSNPSTDKKENHLAARSIMINSEQQIVAVLNDTQKQQFMAWKKSKKEKRKAGEEEVKG